MCSPCAPALEARLARGGLGDRLGAMLATGILSVALLLLLDDFDVVDDRRKKLNGLDFDGACLAAAGKADATVTGGKGPSLKFVCVRRIWPGDERARAERSASRGAAVARSPA